MPSPGWGGSKVAIWTEAPSVPSITTSPVWRGIVFGA